MKTEKREDGNINTAKASKEKKTLSLRTHIWLSFMLLTIVILVLLWLFQYFFLTRYYQTMKARDLAQAAEQITSEIGSRDLGKKMREIAFINSFCIVITDERCNVEMGENAIGSFSILEMDHIKNYNRYIYSLKNQLTLSGDDAIAVRTSDGDSDATPMRKMIFVTSVKADDGGVHYLFIESPVEPIDATVKIIKEQLIYITVILLVLAFIITLLISKRLSKPLVSLSKTAGRFAQGDYSVTFDQSQYTEVKQLSDTLNTASEEVSKVSELRRDLIANVSHDLRTPLTIIKSYAEMIRDLSGDNPLKREQHIQVIIDESDRLANLVNSILELSKLESSAKPLELEGFSVSKKLSEIMERYRILNERDGYNIHFISDEDRICLADIPLIEQAIYNLINNAVNYCGDDKEVIVKQINKENCVRLEITDHGKGIPSEQLQHIFDRYYRAPRTKRDVIGTGLGLSIVKEILKQHKFPFGVYSVVDEGTTFWVEIALAEE